MRVPMIGQWLRAAHQDPERREVCKIFIVTLVVSQLGWIGLLFLDLGFGAAFACITVLVLVELVGRSSPSTSAAARPWHAHHIAERYGLMVIIALGEGLLGTTAALGALIDVTEWSLDAALLGLAGVALPSACGGPTSWCRAATSSRLPLPGLRLGLRPHPAVRRGGRQSGAGLHAAAYYLEHHSRLSAPRPR